MIPAQRKPPTVGQYVTLADHPQAGHTARITAEAAGGYVIRLVDVDATRVTPHRVTADQIRPWNGGRR